MSTSSSSPEDGTPNLTNRGLLFVLTEPGAAVSAAEFHDWYDHEHVPARTAFDGITAATRWAAADGLTPSWLATYDVDLRVLRDERYTSLRAHRSDREQSVVDRLEHLERRTYRLISEDVAPMGDEEEPAPGPTVVAVSLEVPDDAVDELDAWYREEHVPMLLGGAGWRRTRRYELLDGPVTTPRWLAMHDVDGPQAFDTDNYRRATSTARRAELMARVSARERRVFTVHRRF